MALGVEEDFEDELPVAWRRWWCFPEEEEKGLDESAAHAEGTQSERQNVEWSHGQTKSERGNARKEYMEGVSKENRDRQNQSAGNGGKGDKEKVAGPSMRLPSC